jgi:hypothetical protein
VGRQNTEEETGNGDWNGEFTGGHMAVQFIYYVRFDARGAMRREEHVKGRRKGWRKGGGKGSLVGRTLSRVVVRQKTWSESR